MGDRPVWLFYHIQNERGESSGHPNAAKLPSAGRGPGGALTLADILQAFPLAGTSSFHFRFQVNDAGAISFLDLTQPTDVVPTVSGNVIAKVLRLDNTKCATSNSYGLALKPSLPPVSMPVARAVAAAAPAATSVSPVQARSPPTSGARSSMTAGSASPSIASAQPVAATSSGRGTPVSPAPAPALAPAAAAAAAATATTAAHVAGVRSASPAVASGAGSPATSPSTRAAGEMASPIVMLKPVKAVEDTGPVVVPDVVDEDLEGKSDYVKAKVMERRNKLAEEQARRVAEIAERDASAKREQEEGEMLRATYGKRLKEWAEESNGTKKNIRILLSTLQDVLWSDAKWEPVSMAKLIDPRRAKISFMKACTIVHPDKQNTMDNTQRYIAKEVFFYLETAFRHLQETEL